MKYALPFLLCLSLVACGHGNGNAIDKNSNKQTVDNVPVKDAKVDTLVNIRFTDSLVIYYPLYNRIDLACGKRPEQKDSSVIMMVGAAFTGEKLNEFRHTNIAGDHVSNGVFYKGFRCRRNNGAFLYYDNKPHFLHENYADALQTAAKAGGCGVGQEMMIHKGKIVEHTRKDGNVNVFRALCLIDGKVAVADSRHAIRFGNFIKALQEAGATEALYLDMGLGWNYSWYRDPWGRAVEIYPVSTPYSTNWLVFYR